MLPIKEQLQELFHPIDSLNIESNFLIEDLAVVWVDTMISELTNKNKATHNYLSAYNGIYSWAKATDNEKKAGLGIMENNDISESSFGGISDYLDKYKIISLMHAGGMALVRQNSCYNTEIVYARNKEKGMSVNILLCY